MFTMRQLRITEQLARFLFKTKKNLITNISKVTDMYEVFPGSISQEEN